MNIKRITVLAAAVAAGTLLSGCWSDDDGVEPVATPNAVPDSAMASASDYSAYVGALPISDTAPVDIGKLGTAPTSESALPAAI